MTKGCRNKKASILVRDADYNEEIESLYTFDLKCTMLNDAALSIHFETMQLSGLWSACLKCCGVFVPTLNGTRTVPSKTPYDSWAYLRQPTNILHKVHDTVMLYHKLLPPMLQINHLCKPGKLPSYTVTQESTFHLEIIASDYNRSPQSNYLP